VPAATYGIKNTGAGDSLYVVVELKEPAARAGPRKK